MGTYERWGCYFCHGFEILPLFNDSSFYTKLYIYRPLLRWRCWLVFTHSRFFLSPIFPSFSIILSRCWVTVWIRGVAVFLVGQMNGRLPNIHFLPPSLAHQPPPANGFCPDSTFQMKRRRRWSTGPGQVILFRLLYLSPALTRSKFGSFVYTHSCSLMPKTVLPTYEFLIVSLFHTLLFSLDLQVHYEKKQLRLQLRTLDPEECYKTDELFLVLYNRGRILFVLIVAVPSICGSPAYSLPTSIQSRSECLFLNCANQDPSNELADK